MARTAWVDRRFYGMKLVTSLCVAIYMTAVAKAAVIVPAILIRVPQIEQHLRSLEPPIIGRIHNDRLTLDLRTVSSDEQAQLLTLLRADGLDTKAPSHEGTND